MQMSEEVEPRSSPSVVQLTLCQNAQQGGLSRVHITQDSHSQVQELVVVGIDQGSKTSYSLEGTDPNNTVVTNLLVVWHFPNEDLGNLPRHVKIIIHLLLSENRDVSSHSVGNETKTNMSHTFTTLLLCV